MSPLGYCVLCKDVLSFVFKTFDFQVLCFDFCVLCPVLLNGTKNGDVSILVRLSNLYLLACPHLDWVLCKDVLSFVFQTFDFQVLCFGFCVLCPQKFETQNSKHPYIKHNVPMGTS